MQRIGLVLAEIHETSPTKCLADLDYLCLIRPQKKPPKLSGDKKNQPKITFFSPNRVNNQHLVTLDVEIVTESTSSNQGFSYKILDWSKLKQIADDILKCIYSGK